MVFVFVVQYQQKCCCCLQKINFVCSRCVIHDIEHSYTPTEYRVRTINNFQSNLAIIQHRNYTMVTVEWNESDLVIVTSWFISC